VESNPFDLQALSCRDPAEVAVLNQKIENHLLVLSHK